MVVVFNAREGSAGRNLGNGVANFHAACPYSFNKPWRLYISKYFRTEARTSYSVAV